MVINWSLKHVPYGLMKIGGENGRNELVVGSKLLAERLAHVLLKIIFPQQSGFVKR